MIIDVSDKSKLQWQISENIRELKNLRRLCQDRININYARLKNIKPLRTQMEEVNGKGNEESKMKASLCLTEINGLNNKINFNIIISKEQKGKVNKALNTLYDIFNMKKDDDNALNHAIQDYNEKYRRIKNSFNNNAFQEERVMQLFLKVNNDSSIIYSIQDNVDCKVPMMNGNAQMSKEREQDLNEDLSEDTVGNIAESPDKAFHSSIEDKPMTQTSEPIERRMQEYKNDALQNTSVSINNEIEGLYIRDNDTLLISEIQDKVVLPYFGEEVEEKLILEGYKYKNAQEVIDDVYTRKLSDYSNPFKARFKETYNLVTKKDRFSKIDGVKLGLELISERYLHPAVISACRNTDELDTYLDCLKKGELNDFQIFNIKYELNPMVTRKKKR